MTASASHTRERSLPARRLSFPHRGDLQALLRLAVPVVTVQVGMMAMGVVDTVMVGHLSAAALAAVALGNLYFFAVASFALGTLLALDSVVAQAVGARDDESVSRGLQRGLVLAALLSVPTALLLWPASALLTVLRQPPEVIPLAAQYARISSLGASGLLGFIALRQTLQALSRVGPVVVTIVLANLANLALNWVLIYGHLGAPPLGSAGSAWATVASRWLMGLGLLGLGWKEFRPLLLPLRHGLLAPAPLFRLFRHGAPIGVQYLLEYGVFGVVGLLMGTFGTWQVAGHQVALNLASITFMVPLGVSAAAAVLVGHAVGRDDSAGAGRAAGAALASGVAFMSLSAAVFIGWPRLLGRLYTSVPSVLSVAAGLIPIAGVFQVFDGIQVVSIGILRGLGDTRTPMVMNLLGFWLLGLPTSLALGLWLRGGPTGLWWGLVAGLIIVATTLLLRVRSHLGLGVQRLCVEFPAAEDSETDSVRL